MIDFTNEEEILNIGAQIRKEIRLFERYERKLIRLKIDESLFYFNKRSKTTWKRKKIISNLLNKLNLIYDVTTWTMFGGKKYLPCIKNGDSDLYFVMQMNGQLNYKNKEWEK